MANVIEDTEGKSFGFDKPKTKTHLISFRLDQKRFEILEYLFYTLQIKTKKNTQTEKMLALIDSMEKVVKDSMEFEKQLKGLNDLLKAKEKQIMKLEDEIKSLNETVKETKKERAKQRAADVKPGNIVMEETTSNLGKIVKDIESENKAEGQSFKPSVEGIVPDKKYMDQFGWPAPFEKPHCLRNLKGLTDQNQWLIACEVCQAQSPNLFEKCKTDMKRTFINSNPQ